MKQPKKSIYRQLNRDDVPRDDNRFYIKNGEIVGYIDDLENEVIPEEIPFETWNLPAWAMYLILLVVTALFWLAYGFVIVGPA